MEEVIKQAKLAALRILTGMDRTEAQLRQKLSEKIESEEAVEQAIAYVKSFGYIDDEKYAVQYVENHRTSKSRREIFAALCKKGVAKDFIEQGLEEGYKDYDETETIRRLAEKKHFSPENSTFEEKRKLFGYFQRKGFSYDDICQVIQFSSRNA